MCSNQGGQKVKVGQNKVKNLSFWNKVRIIKYGQKVKNGMRFLYVDLFYSIKPGKLAFTWQPITFQ